MHAFVVFVWSFVAAHPGEVIAYACLALMAAVAQLPARYAKAPVLGYAVRFVDRVSVLVHKDAPGTLKWPGVPSILLAAAMDVARGTDRTTQPDLSVPPNLRKRVPLLPVLCLLVGLALLGCTSAQIQADAVDLNKFRGAVRAVCGAFGMVDGLVPRDFGVADASLTVDASAVQGPPSAGGSMTATEVSATVHALDAMDAGR